MAEKIRLVFWGSPPLSASFLRHLVTTAAGPFEVVACVTQPEKIVQRQGKNVVRSAVHTAALEQGIPVFTPKSVKKEFPELLAELSKIGFDLFVVVAYGKILPIEIIDAPRLKSVNFHGSLLPLLRGASPVEHAILYGFQETGWTLQRIVPELDAGDIIAQTHVPISDTETTATLFEKLTQDLLAHGAQMLSDYAGGASKIEPQEHVRATHCGKLSAEDGKLDMQKPAAEIRNRYRAFTPRPGVFVQFRAKKIKLNFDLQAPVSAFTGQPGSLHSPAKGELWLICGDGRGLRLDTLTPEGKKAMLAADFLNGYRPQPHELFT
jgi:methionyl-tRNA formyltransferase